MGKSRVIALFIVLAVMIAVRGDESLDSMMDDLIDSEAVVIFSKSYCPYCKAAKELLAQVGANPKIVELDEETKGEGMQAFIKSHYSHHTVPAIFIDGELLGGTDDLIKAHGDGSLKAMLDDLSYGYDDKDL